MTSRILRSILIVAMSVLLASFGILFGVMYSYQTTVQENSLRTMLDLAAEGVSQNGVDYLEALDFEREKNEEATEFDEAMDLIGGIDGTTDIETSSEVMEDISDEISSSLERCRLTWIAQDGEVLFDSAYDNHMENHLEREEIAEAFKTGEGISVRFSNTAMEKTIYCAIKLDDGTVLRASVASATVWMLILGMIQPIALVLGIALAVSAWLAYRLSKRITEPLETIDLNNPLEGLSERGQAKAIYEELEPFLRRIDMQNKRITAQKKELDEKRQQMDFAEENRREFTANVSHELKTPLQSIMGSAELLENDLVKSEDIPRFASNMRKESTRLLALIEDIIHLSRLDESIEMQKADVDLYGICEEEIEALQAVAKDKEVTVRLMGEHFEYNAVPQLMQEVVHNLVENAIKYNKPGGMVTVRAYRTEENCILSVSDTGIGIAKEHQEHIFERFYRVDKSHSKATGGTGLGLSIVKHAVSYMKGEIKLESELGVGTTITVIFR